MKQLIEHHFVFFGWLLFWIAVAVSYCINAYA